MNWRNIVLLIALNIIIILSFYNCQKDDSETRSDMIANVYDIKTESAVFKVEIKNFGQNDVDYGVCYNIEEDFNNSVKISSGLSELSKYFEITVEKLKLDTKYFYWAYSFDGDTYTYTETKSFRTGNGIIELKTISVSNINESSAKSGGNILNYGRSVILDKGVCWSAIKDPEISDSFCSNKSNDMDFECLITGLLDGVSYKVKSYATNIYGTYYGNTIEFSTNKLYGGTLTDIENNTYKWTRLGDQVWLSENLKVTKSSSGKGFSYIEDNVTWGNLKDNDIDAAYCFLENNENNTYSVLYTYAAAKEVCPDGWHLPNDNDFRALKGYLDDEGFFNREALALKSERGWESSDGNNDSSNGIDKYGFSALPSGHRDYENGTFWGITQQGLWWLDYEDTESTGNAIHMHSSVDYISTMSISKSNGASVRCIRDF